ncbi:hypothetical protein FS837_004640 [Tulasnella sp. UAMH 9824]|nr:hypothetical protein FS837_004640 [Tulasnella sp. UAMH 9824]
MRPSTVLFSILAFTTTSILAQPTDPTYKVLEARTPSRHQHRAHAHSIQENQKRQLRKRKAAKRKACQLKHSTTASGPKETGSSNDGPSGGVITVNDPKCGPNGATKSVTKTTSPNGSLDWMDCGIQKNSNSKWTPPKVTMSDVITVSLDEALAMDNSPYKACSKYLDLFKSVAGDTTINGVAMPPIMLAAFAMQESTCNPKTRGQGGEVGMFQLSQDKCPGGKASDACYDPETNTRIAAKFIKSQIENDAGGNVFLMTGSYNGWSLDMSYYSAIKAADSSCCRCQNNLDYVFQFWGGWMLGVDAYAKGLGKYFNLEVCNGNDKRRLSSLEAPFAEECLAEKRWSFSS